MNNKAKFKETHLSEYTFLVFCFGFFGEVCFCFVFLSILLCFGGSERRVCWRQEGRWVGKDHYGRITLSVKKPTEEPRNESEE